ncbi:uncharacterized protein ASCRUDRAFT_6537 [Ascoidea rubescens DSM 1968]|uniref:Uncharacterized protein n=1 Tax=Ascoidea rubescens DSM 1968 TaxID=1344418 RepID=A0A1D2VMY8_9ASCO|nr:hypothetical protein ASCRUDRAFT_6537 [Ascoidea rubescens DSM 1968]ODV62915.1 hypothetical protein ASCRUDRAFT_6537 [Ascoidea rubescens DSM 1968]
MKTKLILLNALVLLLIILLIISDSLGKEIDTQNIQDTQDIQNVQDIQDIVSDGQRKTSESNGSHKGNNDYVDFPIKSSSTKYSSNYDRGKMRDTSDLNKNRKAKSQINNKSTNYFQKEYKKNSKFLRSRQKAPKQVNLSKEYQSRNRKMAKNRKMNQNPSRSKEKDWKYNDHDDHHKKDEYGRRYKKSNKYENHKSSYYYNRYNDRNKNRDGRDIKTHRENNYRAYSSKKFPNIGENNNKTVTYHFNNKNSSNCTVSMDNKKLSAVIKEEKYIELNWPWNKNDQLVYTVPKSKKTKLYNEGNNSYYTLLGIKFINKNEEEYKMIRFSNCLINSNPEEENILEAFTYNNHLFIDKSFNEFGKELSWSYVIDNVKYKIQPGFKYEISTLNNKNYYTIYHDRGIVFYEFGLKFFIGCFLIEREKGNEIVKTMENHLVIDQTNSLFQNGPVRLNSHEDVEEYCQPNILIKEQPGQDKLKIDGNSIENTNDNHQLNQTFAGFDVVYDFNEFGFFDVEISNSFETNVESQ